MNAKLERPLDSHTPQTEQLYWYDDEDWGETHEDEDYNASQWEASDVYHAEDEDEYNAYNAEEEADNTQVEVDPQSQDEFDEDDQDRYLWHRVNKKHPIMDAYISEAQVMSCDVVDMLHIDILQKDLIQPA